MGLEVLVQSLESAGRRTVDVHVAESTHRRVRAQEFPTPSGEGASREGVAADQHPQELQTENLQDGRLPSFGREPANGERSEIALVAVVQAAAISIAGERSGFRPAD
jgi:hypothetical protein